MAMYSTIIRQYSSKKNNDDYDVLNSQNNDDEYTTYRSIPTEAKDEDEDIPEEAPTTEEEADPAEGEEPTPEDPEEEPAPEGGEDMPPEEGADEMGGSEAGMGGDEGMPGEDAMGMGMEDEGPKDPKEVSNVYDLKKIHARLVSIQSYLASAADTELIELRSYITQSLELFDSLISNLDLFKDKLPNIIKKFYKLLDEVFSTLSKYYKKKERDEKNEKNNVDDDKEKK